MNENLLPGIKSVQICKTANLQPDVLDYMDESKILKIYGTLYDVPIVQNGTMSVKSELIKGQTVFTVKAQFQICASDITAKEMALSLAKNIYAFVFTNLNGVKMLVGTHQKPVPTVAWQYLNDETPTGKRGYFVEVTYQNTHSYIVLE